MTVPDCGHVAHLQYCMEGYMVAWALSWLCICTCDQWGPWLASQPRSTERFASSKNTDTKHNEEAITRVY